MSAPQDMRQEVANRLHVQECYSGCDMEVHSSWRDWADCLIDARADGLDSGGFDELLDEAGVTVEVAKLVRDGQVVAP